MVDNPLVGPHDLRPTTFQNKAYVHPNQPRQQLRVLSSSGEGNPSLQRLRSAISQYRRPPPVTNPQHQLHFQNTRAVTPTQSDNVSGLQSPPATPPRARLVDKYLENCSAIVEYEKGEWAELHCGICGVNATTLGKFLRGLSGFIMHLTAMHNPLPRKRREDNIGYILRTCVVRKVSASEVDEINAGHVKIPVIASYMLSKEPSLNCGSNASAAGVTEDQDKIIAPAVNKRCHDPEDDIGHIYAFAAQGNIHKRIQVEDTQNQEPLAVA
jgi:hypothetical protein